MPTPPNPSPLPTGSPESVTRVDWAHGVQVGSNAEADEPSLELLQAIAGQDSQTANHQLRTQALELAAILRDKQHLLEQRESEINARSAALENELRVARLRGQSRQETIPSLETVRETLASNPTTGVVSSGQASLLHRGEGDLSLRMAGLSATAGSTGTAGTVPWTEVLPATQASSAKSTAKSVVHAGIDLSKNTDELFAVVDDFVPPWRFRDASNLHTNESGQTHGDLDLPWGPDDSRNIQRPSADSPDNASIRLSAEDERLLQSGIDLSGSASGIDLDFQREYELVQAQRSQLQEREETLEHRARQLEQVQDEITDLHREALEMRLATEQLWEELVTALPREDLACSLNDLRARLADHYRLANDALTRRKEELISFRSQLNSQEQRIRQQRREIQLWADRRYDEIEARAARLMVRETELDKLEAELHRQSLRWQQQRDAYRREIERLSWQLRDQQHSVKS